MQYQFDFFVVLQSYDRLLLGCLSTLGLAAISLLLGFVLSIAIILMRASKYRIFQVVAYWYVQVFRNTPFLVQIYFVYFGFPSLGIKFDSNTAAIIALSANLAAYSSEIIRGGIASIPKGQTDAGLALGFSNIETFFIVILKPALRKVYPGLVSQFVLLMLTTSIASAVGATELTYYGQEIETKTFRSFEAYFTITGLYLLMAIGMSSALKRVEKYFFHYPV